MLTTQNILLVLSAGLTALVAGLFYGFSCSVIPGLNKLSDIEYLRSMQNINRAIINPVFMLSFLGAVIVLPICTYYTYRYGNSSAFTMMLVATLLYVLGVFIFTMGLNVPLNNMLDKYDLTSASTGDLSKWRTAFEIPWNRYHHIRTVFSFLSLLFTLFAIIKK